MAVMFRQNRRLANAAGTWIAVVAPSFTMKMVPLTAFSGRPPSAGGLNRAFRQVPVHVGGVTDIQPVGFEPPHHRVLRVEDSVVLFVAASRNKWPVVTDLVRASGVRTGRARVEAVTPVRVVGLPGGVRRLEQQIRPPRVVADNEDDVTATPGPGAIDHPRDLREVD